MKSSMYLFFLYNFIADYLILYFVKKELFPHISRKRICMAAALFSASYIIWEIITIRMPFCFREILKWSEIILLFSFFFKIRSPKQIGRTLLICAAYLFFLGGGMSFFLHVHT